jgi:hypothetical protein
MNVVHAILIKMLSVLLFAVMSVLVRWLGDRVPLGQVVFFRSAFAILPVVAIFAWRGELMAAVRTDRPFGHLGRGMISVAGMFLNFAALARLPLADANALSFASPLITVALAAFILGEQVRIYRWSAVAIGFVGVLVMLWPYLDIGHMTASTSASIGAACALAAAFTNAGSVIQTRRLTDSETTSSIVFYFSFICMLFGAVTLARARRAGRDRLHRRHLAHLPHRELPLRRRLGGGAVRLHGDAVGVPVRLRDLRRGADDLRVRRLGRRGGKRPVRDLARAPARHRAHPHQRDRRAAGRQMNRRRDRRLRTP